MVLAAATGAEGEQLLAALRAHGEAGTNLAELGVGTNDRATLTGALPGVGKMRDEPIGRPHGRHPCSGPETQLNPRLILKATIDR